jgi:DNA-binding HxlR family transcriptional regulator
MKTEALRTRSRTSSGPAPAIGDVLRLLGSGAAGEIMAALREEPLRTKELTARVVGFTPRTTYRYLGRLVKMGVLDREDEPGIPSKVVYRLAEPCGLELHELADAFAATSLSRSPSGEIVPHSWSYAILLADLWEAEMLGALNLGACTVTELARVNYRLGFHQVSRRITLFQEEGLVRRSSDGGRRRRYELTGRARRGTVLIAGVGRWRERHFQLKRHHGVSASEAAQLLATALPLAALPGDGEGKVVALIVVPPGRDEAESEAISVEVGADGAVTVAANPAASPDAWAQGGIAEWLEAFCRGRAEELSVGGAEASTAEACLEAMRAALWAPEGGA